MRYPASLRRCILTRVKRRRSSLHGITSELSVLSYQCIFSTQQKQCILKGVPEMARHKGVHYRICATVHVGKEEEYHTHGSKKALMEVVNEVKRH